MTKFLIYFTAFITFNAAIAQENSKKDPQIQDEEIVEEEVPKNTDVPFATAGEVPIYPGCEESLKSEMRKCFQEQVMKHIAKNFRYPAEAQRKGIQGRVKTFFTVDKDGSIGNIKVSGPNAILETEAARIIKLLPKIIPGKIKGEAVRVPFSVPITFSLSPKKIDVSENTQNLIPLDSLDLEPKFLDYSFLFTKGKKKNRKLFNSETPITKCIQRHVMNHFRYPEIAQDKNIQGRTDVELIITKDGSLSLKRAKGEHHILNNEARRIVSFFPKKVIPGRKNGKSVDTIITFPLTFKLQ
ncbi:energy transducer TonB [Maribacter sp.]|nr:energy transducer TonB [Maribacter sp.]